MEEAIREKEEQDEEEEEDLFEEEEEDFFLEGFGGRKGGRVRTGVWSSILS